MLVPDILNHPITHKKVDVAMLMPDVLKDPKNKPVQKGRIIEAIVKCLQDYDEEHKGCYFF